MKDSKVEILDTKKWNFFSLSLRSDGLMVLEVEGNKEVEIIHVKQIADAMRELGRKKKFPSLFSQKNILCQQLKPELIWQVPNQIFTPRQKLM